MSQWQAYELIPADAVAGCAARAAELAHELQAAFGMTAEISVDAEAMPVFCAETADSWQACASGVFVREPSAALATLSNWLNLGVDAPSASEPLATNFLRAFAQELVPLSADHLPSANGQPGPGVRITLTCQQQDIALLISAVRLRKAPPELPVAAPFSPRPQTWVGARTVTLSAELPGIAISFDELVSLAAGDLLLMDSTALTRVELKSATGETVMSGRVGAVNEKLGVEIQ